MNAPSIIFPHLNIEINYLPDGFDIFGLRINFYGILIAIGMVLGVLVALSRAKKTGQRPDDYIDIAIFSIIFGIIGARLYYVLFNLDYYLKNPLEIINIRQGGLAIYGGVIAGVITMFVISRIKKISFLMVLDTCAPGVALAQAFGRWGNFFNREAFGEYTDSLFAMQIKYSEVGNGISESIKNNIIEKNGTEYIQVSPTFLYESAWCLVLFILIIIFRKFQQYNGEVILWYVGGYALERTFVEGLRTDSLYVGDTGIRISQLLSIILLAGSFIVLVVMRIRIWTGKMKIE